MSNQSTLTISETALIAQGASPAALAIHQGIPVSRAPAPPKDTEG